MDYLGALRMFVRAVEAGSFSKAAIATNTKTSTVSRAIAGLEEDLGVSLFHRTTRRAHLTEPGATFYEHARSVLHRSLRTERGRCCPLCPALGVLRPGGREVYGRRWAVASLRMIPASQNRKRSPAVGAIVLRLR
jgi:DNA-binding transcriptional LysR family regulator